MWGQCTKKNKYLDVQKSMSKGSYLWNGVAKQSRKQNGELKMALQLVITAHCPRDPAT